MVADEAQTSFVPSVYHFPPPPRELSAKLKLFWTSTSLSWYREPGLLGFSTLPSGQRSDMSQVLFQQLVPLLVKCKDCEER